MVHIYNEITIYIYKAIFPSGASPPNPQDPVEGVPPLHSPTWKSVHYFWGVKTSWGINTAENKRPLNQEDNQAPQPTISHLETDLNNSTTVVYAGL
jgi:hypothetical protein